MAWSTNSVRFYPREFAAYFAAKTRALGGVIVELWRQHVLGARPGASAGAIIERQRVHPLGAVHMPRAGLAIERRHELGIESPAVLEDSEADQMVDDTGDPLLVYSYAIAPGIGAITRADAGLAATRQREGNAGLRASTSAGNLLENHSYLVDDATDTLVDDTGDPLLAVS